MLDAVLEDGSPAIGAAPSSFLEEKAVAAAALPVPGDHIANPKEKVKELASAASKYEFAQKRLAAWHAAGRPSE